MLAVALAIVVLVVLLVVVFLVVVIVIVVIVTVVMLDDTTTTVEVALSEITTVGLPPSGHWSCFVYVLGWHELVFLHVCVLSGEIMYHGFLV